LEVSVLDLIIESCWNNAINRFWSLCFDFYVEMGIFFFHEKSVYGLLEK
jgi:hypothetical protein